MRHWTMPHAERWQVLLRRRSGLNEAARLIARAQAHYDLLERQIAEVPAGLDRTQWRERVLPVLAFYKVLREEGWEIEAALTLLETLLWVTFDRERRALRFLRRLPPWVVWPFFRVLLRGQLRWFANGEAWRRLEEGGARVLTFDVTRCDIHAALQAQGAPQLTAVFCAMDERLAALLPASIRWRRGGTQVQGERCCDFRHERQR
ncbi:MAG: L-2-amino-thiazoline-4-carboxylic acid hydrolase [Anaerolineae bacterium]